MQGNEWQRRSTNDRAVFTQNRCIEIDEEPEYKRALNENVINQGLFYLDWLLDHKADFKLLVMDQFGADAVAQIDWTAPRLLCIAGDFTR